MIGIREVLVALAFGATGSQWALAAQPLAATRIGFLWTSSPEVTSECMEGFRHGLREAGRAEGRDVFIEQRWAADVVQRLDPLAAELVRVGVKIIVTQGTPAARAAKTATATIPIVMAINADPVATKLVASLARPGGNVTGLSLVELELHAKRLELVREANPKASRVAVIVDATNINPTGAPIGLEDTETAARALGLRLDIVRVRRPDDFAGAFAAARAARADFVVVVPSPILSFHWKPLVELAAKHRLPTVFGQRSPVEAGGLISYGPSYPDLCRSAAGYVDRILKGAAPADLPVTQPTKFELAINLKTAKAIGLTVRQELLLRADRVIE